MPGTRLFGGTAYLDPAASEPAVTGWMAGASPARERQVRFEDDRFLDFPELRWSLSHLRELVPTVNVPRATGGAAPPPALPAGDGAAIGSLRFRDLNGNERTWDEAVTETYTDGIVVLHRGQPLYRRYAGALQADLPHACFSITKSYVATLAATLVHERVLDAERPAVHYVPELRGTAFADATIDNLLDMQVGVAFTEDYVARDSDFWAYATAGGLRPRAAGAVGPTDYYAYLRTLAKQGEHGTTFSYKTVTTEALGWVVRRVLDMPLSRLLAERIWQRIGCENDAYFAIDAAGVEMSGAGLCATLGDLARFGELMRCEGDHAGTQVIPAAVIADIRRGAAPGRFPQASYPLLGGYSYRRMWWVAHDAVDAYEARGIHGQRLYIAPRAELVIARFASHPIASSAANDPITLPAFTALARSLAS